MMGRLCTLFWAAFITGKGQETYLRGGITSEEFDDIAHDPMVRRLGGESGGHGAFSYMIPCVPEPGGRNLFEPCGKVLPDGEDKTYEVHFGTKLFSFTLPGYHDEEVAAEKWYSVLLTSLVLAVVCLPLIILRFVKKPAFDALFGSVPRADKDPVLTKEEIARVDGLKMDATGDAFIAPVNYYRCLAMILIVNPPDVSYVLWIKLFVTALLVAAVQVGTPIYLLHGWAQKYQVFGIVPIFEMHPTELPTRILGVSLAVLITYKVFDRKVEDAYDANMYIVSRKYTDPNSKEDAVSPSQRTLLAKDDELIMRNKIIKHFWLSLSMALKMAMCIVTFFLCICEVMVLEHMDWTSIVTTVTALYIVADLDKTAIDLDSELKDRYRNYVLRLDYADATYHQETQDRYTLARKIFQYILQFLSILIVMSVPLVQFQYGDILIPSQLADA